METRIPKSMIVGIQSVAPVEVTKHRKVRTISVKDPVGAGIFRRTLNIVMHYKEVGDSCERGWLVAGWIKESLGRVMTEYPMLSGRLQRWRIATEDGLEVVSNDCGVRLVEAKFPSSLQEFLEMVQRDKRRAEAETVFWKDIDEVDPLFSPLFYVQVTNFESGGYSIGISCSILIADLILGTDFLNKWAQIQRSLAHFQATLKPIFHLPSYKQDLGNFITELSRSASVLDRGDPVIFRTKTCSEMSLARTLKAVVNSQNSRADVFLFIKEQGGGENDCVKVELHSKNEENSDFNIFDLEKRDVEVLNVSLRFGEGLERSSCWVGSVTEGVAFVVPSTLGDATSLAKFIIALPKM